MTSKCQPLFAENVYDLLKITHYLVNVAFVTFRQTHMMAPGHHTERDKNLIFLQAMPDLRLDRTDPLVVRV